MRIFRLVARVAYRLRPVTSTLGLAGANARVHGGCSSLRSRSQTSGGCMRRNGRSSSRGAAGCVQALRAG